MALIVILLVFLIFKTFKMDADFKTLKQEFDTLKEAVATERQQVTDKLAEQDASIAALEQAIANNGTPEEIQALIQDVKATTAAIKGIYKAPGEDTGEEAKQS